MFYRDEAVAKRRHDQQKLKQSNWLSVLIYSALGFIGVQVVGIIMMRSVVECTVRYSHADGACGMLLNHYIRQTWPGMGLLLSEIMVTALLVASLIGYLRTPKTE